MTSLAVRLMEIDDTQLEEFIEVWVERRSQQYDRIERTGAANDKGRDVIGFLTRARHEGPWHLFQSKRKTRGGKLGKSEGLAELGKVFFHHCQGAYKTLPEKYVFVAPRGIVGSLMDLINNPSTLGTALIDGWDEHCSKSITRRETVALTPEIRAAIEGFDFSRVEHLTAPMLVKDQAAGPALSKVLGLVPDEAPVAKRRRPFSRRRRTMSTSSGTSMEKPAAAPSYRPTMSSRMRISASTSAINAHAFSKPPRSSGFTGTIRLQARLGRSRTTCITASSRCTAIGTRRFSGVSTRS